MRRIAKREKHKKRPLNRTAKKQKTKNKRRKDPTVKRVRKDKIASHTPLHKDAKQWTTDAVELYNQVNYYIRQHYFNKNKPENEQHAQVQEAMTQLEEWAVGLNELQSEKKQKTYPLPSEAKSLNNKNFWDALFVYLKTIGEEIAELFYALPGQTAQHVIQDVCTDWKSYYKSAKSYAKTPGGFTGRPKPPKYKKSGSHITIHFTPQQCNIEQNAKTGEYYSTFPCSDATYNLGKRTFPGKMKEVRIVPKGMRYDVEFTYEFFDNCPEPIPDDTPDYRRRILGFDPGVSDFLTIFNNIGEDPIVVSGGMLKSRNQYANKKTSELKSKLPKGVYMSARIQGIWDDRNAFFDDFMHRLSRRIIDVCLVWRIDTIVIGKNKGWKFKPRTGKVNNQNFACIPFESFVEKLRYKAYEHGIEVIVTEESYTSKASFLDLDPLPVYGEPGAHEAKFSGRRVSRSWYRSSDGTMIHADVNGAGNSIRKVFPRAFDLFEDLRDSGVVDTPRRLDLGYVSGHPEKGQHVVAPATSCPLREAGEALPER